MSKPHDCWNPACITAQHSGQSCALCLACQIIRDAMHALHPGTTAGGPSGREVKDALTQKGSSRS